MNRTMSDTALVMTIARREFTTQVRGRAFWASLAIVLFMLVVMFLVQRGMTPTGSADTTIGVLGDQPALRAALKDHKVIDHPDLDAARRALSDGDVDAVFVSGDEVLSRDGLTMDVEEVVTETHRRAVHTERLRQRGVTGEQAEEILTVAPPRRSVLEADGIDLIAGMTAVGAVLLTVMMIMFGGGVTTGVVEEKSSRVVEILLAKVSARQLLAGKIIGLGLSALLAILLTLTAGAGALLFSGVLPSTGETIMIAATLLAWFIPGFALYATIYAVAGSLVSGQEDVNYVLTPVMTLTMAGLIGPMSVATSDNDLLIRVLSIVPGLSSTTMPVRIAASDVPWFDIVAAVVLLALSIIVLVRVGARLYTGGILHTRGNVGITTAWRRARQ